MNENIIEIEQNLCSNAMECLDKITNPLTLIVVLFGTLFWFYSNIE